MSGRFVVREFRTGRGVESVDSFEEGFVRCIELYLASSTNPDLRRSYYTEKAVA